MAFEMPRPTYDVFLDSYLALKRCPHCGISDPSLTSISEFVTKDFIDENERLWGVYQCKKCGGVVTAAASGKGHGVLEIYPNSINVDNAIPLKAKTFLSQAVDSFHAPSGAIMLACSSVDAMLKSKGLVNGNLYPRIKEAVEKNLLTIEMASWAHEIRLDANDERHADLDSELPNEKDARKAVEFALALGEFLFVLPSRVARGLKNAKETQPNNTSKG